MTHDWWIALLKDSWAIGALVFLVYCLIKLVAWFKPWIEQIFKKLLEWLDKGIEINSTNAETLRQQNPIMLDTQREVIRIGERTLDRESLISNFHTNKKLDSAKVQLAMALQNDREFADAGIAIIHAVCRVHPELSDHFDEAVRTFERIKDTKPQNGV